MGGGEALAGEAGSPRSPELYDFSDDSDYAAAAAASNHVMRSKSADGSSGETARADVIYEKQRVTIHPTQYGSDRISGKLRLFLQQGSLFLSWEPNEGVDSWSSSTVNMEIENYRNLYTIKALPLSDIRFIRRHAPTFGSDYIIIVLSSGLTFPPFYFYNGGVRELFATLKQHVSIIRSDDDPNVFLVNDFQDPLQLVISGAPRGCHCGKRHVPTKFAQFCWSN